MPHNVCYGMWKTLPTESLCSHTSTTSIGLHWVSDTVGHEISYIKSSLAAHQDNPADRHYDALKRISRYLRGHPNLVVTYSKLSDPSNLGWYWLGHLPRHSKFTRWYDVYVDAFNWRAYLQKRHAYFSANSEYVAASAAASQAQWLRLFREEWEIPVRLAKDSAIPIILTPQENKPLPLHIDNIAAIAMTHISGPTKTS